MTSLKELVLQAEKDHYAIGHFNFSNLEALWGIFRAAKMLGVPVIAGVSEGERDFVGVRQAAALVKSIREEFDYPIFLNADHTYSFERVKEAVDAGYDSVIFDGTELSFEENIRLTKQCVEYAKSKNPNMLVEGELGFIGKSSKILDALPEGVKITEEYLTKPDEAKRFVAETGVDMLAPAIGNIHGMLKSGKDPELNVKVTKAVHDAIGIPMTLHGGSGNSEADFKGVISAGVSIVHINTEIRVAFRRGLALALQEDPDQVAPYKYLKGPLMAVEKVVTEKLKVFSNL